MINIPCVYGICQKYEQYGCNNTNIEFSEKKKYIKELKYSVISLKTANLSNPRMGFDSLGNRFFQFTQTVSKIFKFGEKQTY